MHIEVLVEDRSGSVLLDKLIEKMLHSQQSDHTWSVRPHRGKGFWPDDLHEPPRTMSSGLFDLLPAKLRAYESVCSPDDWLMVVVLDADDLDPAGLEDEIRRKTTAFTGQLPMIIALAIEEMEAWILGDRRAIREAYPQADLSRMAEYAQDSICGTWEILARVILGQDADRLIRLGYPAVGRHKSEWAGHIAARMDPERNISPSFRQFRNRLLETLASRVSRHDR